MCGHNEHYRNHGCHCEQGQGGRKGDDCHCDENRHHQQPAGCCAHEHGSGQRFHRRFVTKEEQIAWLQGYLKDLQTETKAVEEHIAEIMKTGQERDIMPG